MTTSSITVERSEPEAAPHRKPSAVRPSSARRTLGFVGTSGSLIAFFVAAGAPTPLLPLYEESWHFAPSTLTLAFGVYAIALVASLLVFGSLSDHVGRKPVLVGALALELVAMVVFLEAHSIGWLMAGRILQGAATGIASSSFGAAAVELASERRKKLGALMTGLASTAGLAVGALAAGLVALAIPRHAAAVVWAALAVVMVAGTILALLTPETAGRRAGALASLRPSAGVPRPVRPLFAATAPSIAGAFLLAAFYLGLVPTVLRAVFGVTSPLTGGLATFVMFGVAATASVTTSGIHPHRLKLIGNVAVVIGALLLIGAVAAGSLGLVWAAAAVSGFGLGSTFAGSTRGIVPEVAPQERAGLFAALFLVAYVSLGGAAILAGFAAAAIGVATMTTWYGILVALVGVAGLALSAGLVRGRGVPSAR